MMKKTSRAVKKIEFGKSKNEYLVSETMNVLENLVYQGGRSNEFHPKCHLCIQTDSGVVGGASLRVGGAMSMAITDLTHTCLMNYFSPHTDAATVSWMDRETLKQHLLAAVIDKHSGCIMDYIDNIVRTNQKLANTDAVLFLSRDARSFVYLHKKTFLDTLAKCLNTTKSRILIMDMSMKPENFD